MNESLIAQIVVGVLTVISSYSLLNWRIKALEKKVDEHNGYAQKFAQSSTDIALIKKDIEYIKERVD